MKPFEIFRTGEQTDSKGRKMMVTAAMLSALASNYAAAGVEAPIVVGHPKADSPAYGWISKLTVQGDSLIAHPKDVHPEFEANVKAGAYRNRSIALFGPLDPANPNPGDYYPRHVGFLGGAAPAIAGLKPVEFSGGQDAYEFTTAQKLDDAEDMMVGVQWIMNGLRRVLFGQRQFEAGLDTTSLNLSPLSPKPQKEKDPMTDKSNTADIVALETQLKADRDAFEKERAEFAAKEMGVRMAADAALISALEKDGKLPPAAKVGLAEFMAALPHDAPFEFSAQDGTKSKQSPREYFHALLSGAKPVINFSEVSADDGEDVPALDTADANALATAAIEYQAEQTRNGRTITIDMAVAHVAKKPA